MPYTHPSLHARATRAAAAAAVLVAGLALGTAAPAHAAEAPVQLGTAESFAVLAGSTVTNTGSSVITGDLGVSPGSAVTGFPPGTVTGGTIHVSDAVALQAQDNLTTGYNDAAGRSVTADLTGQDLGGLTLVSGVYGYSTSAQLTGTLTLDAEGDPDAVFIFQVGSTLTTASNANVSLINGASACNVFWQVGSSATLGTNTEFVGTIMALASATLTTGVNVQGRVLARNAAVTLDSNVITAPNCEAATTTPTPPTASASVGVPPTSPADEPGSGTPSGGDGGGSGDGPGGPGEPTVPVGHPETGLAPAGDGTPVVLFGAGFLALLGAVVAFRRAVPRALRL